MTKHSHWVRQYLISEPALIHIRHELEQLWINTAHTPDTEACFKSIIGTLESVKGK